MKTKYYFLLSSLFICATINKTFAQVAIGVNAVAANASVSIGDEAGNYAIGGESSVAIGSGTLMGSSGYDNCALGLNAGINAVGSSNIMIGQSVGGSLTGDSNILIGVNVDNSGTNGTFSNKLMIFKYYDDYPLVWGDFDNQQVKLNAKVGIGYGIGAYPTSVGGVDVSAYNLFVTGGILTEELRLSPSANNTWADYVFHKNYNLKPLAQLEQFISDNGHLPNVPSACQVQEEGIALGEMAKIQQEKIEELTLYIIEQNKINEAQNKLIMQLSERLNAIEKR